MRKTLLALAIAAIALPAFAISPTTSETAKVPFATKSANLPTELANLQQIRANGPLRAADITTPPEGTREDYTMTASYVNYNNTGIYNDYAVERSTHMIFAENDEVYLYDLASVMSMGSYIKGKKEGNQIRFDFPQVVVDYGDGMCIFLTKMEIKNPVDLTSYEVVEEDNYVTYTIYDDGTIAMDLDNSIDEEFPQYIIGLTYAYENPPLEQYWMYAGDFYQELVPSKYKKPEIPDTAVLEPWVVHDGYYGDYWCEIAIDGSDVYIKNAMPNVCPGDFFSGKLEDDKVTVSYQFMGVNYYYNVYEWLVVVDANTLEPLESVTYTYDSEKKTLIPDQQVFLVASAKEDPADYQAGCIDLLYYPWFGYVDGSELNPTPKAPEFYAYFPYEASYGCGGIRWFAPALNVDDMPYPNGRVYANLYINDELFTSDPAKYGIQLTDIPAGYESYNWSYSQDYITLYTFFDEEPSTIGCQLFYLDEEGNKHYSEKVTHQISEGISSVDSDMPTQVRYTDMMGRTIEQPTPGLYIKTSVLSDGQVKSEKVMIK